MTSSRTSSRYGWRFVILALAGISAMVMLACGSNSGPDDTSSQGPFAGVQYDYDPAQGPAELAAHSTVVVRGVTGTPHQGRIWGESRQDWGATTSLVLPIRIERIEAGELDPRVEDTIYLEMDAPVEQPDRDDRARFARGMTDREGIFFLQPAPEEASRYVAIVNPDAGRPTGQPLYQASSPEGILITRQDGAGVWSVNAGEDFPDSSLDDFMPGVERFPARVTPEQEDALGKGQPAP